MDDIFRGANLAVVIVVEFDLDDGPVVDAVIPSLFLLPQDLNNMYA